RWQLGIRRRRGGVEQPIERGVIAIHERNAEQRSRRHPQILPSRSRSGQPPRRVFNGTPTVESGEDEFLTTNRGLVLDPDQRPKNRRFKSGPTEISLHGRALSE